MTAQYRSESEMANTKMAVSAGLVPSGSSRELCFLAFSRFLAAPAIPRSFFQLQNQQQQNQDNMSWYMEEPLWGGRCFHACDHFHMVESGDGSWFPVWATERRPSLRRGQTGRRGLMRVGQNIDLFICYVNIHFYT